MHEIFVCGGFQSNPTTMGWRYVEHLYETKRLPFNIRMDHGTETGKLAAIQKGDMEDSTDSVVYGPSTSNKIERCWRNLNGICMKEWKFF